MSRACLRALRGRLAAVLDVDFREIELSFNDGNGSPMFVSFWLAARSSHPGCIYI